MFKKLGLGVCLKHKVPYTVAIHYGSPELIPGRMPDVFDPQWEIAVRKRMEQEKGVTADDPWNIGYFIDNERFWSWQKRGAGVGLAALKCGPKRAGKLKFVEMLRTRYGTIDKLNAAWQAAYASWEAVLEATSAEPDVKIPSVLLDCGDFGLAFAERYYSVCRSAVKEVAPNTLYLGSRLNGHIDVELMEVIGKHCDVISYNIYDKNPVNRLEQYASLDRPFMVTEWGIATDPVQSPYAGKEKSPDPASRASAIRFYLQHAIPYSHLVGAHFFQYRDQPLSGRPDGENSLRGFLSVTDTPHRDLIEAVREVSYDMYTKRFEGK